MSLAKPFCLSANAEDGVLRDDIWNERKERIVPEDRLSNIERRFSWTPTRSDLARNLIK